MSLASFAFGESQPLSGALEAYEQISLLTAARLPLHEGLRALAEESSDRHTRPWLLAWAAAVEQGQTLEQGLEGVRNRIPARVANLLSAATNSSELATTLEQFITARRASNDQNIALWHVLAYPLLLIAMVLLTAGMLSFVLFDLTDMLQAFDLPIPPSFGTFRQVYEHRHAVLTTTATVVAGLALLRISPARYIVAWLTAQLPLVGLHGWYVALAETARHLQSLVAQQVPLPRAAALAAQAVDHPLLNRAAPELEQDLLAGQSLGAALRARPAVPASVTFLVEWGERHSCLNEMLGLVAEFCDERAKAERLTTKLLASPLAFLLVLLLVLTFVGSVMAPLLNLIQRIT